MKKIVPVCVILFLIFVLSCKKILNIEQKMDIPNDRAISSVKDLEAVLAGAYDGLQSGNVFGGNLVVYADLLADDVKVNESKLYYFGTYEIYNRRTTVQINALRSMWSECYSTVNRANNVIHVIDNNLLNGDEFDAKKSKLKGEALFIRAAVHFELLRFWALPYDVNAQGGNIQPGIPYRTRPTLSGFENLAMARNTVEEVYSKVIADLTSSYDLLLTANQKKSSSRASAYAAAGYLARVYFCKGDYSNADSWANTVITNGGYALNSDASAAFKSSGENATSESIFQLVNLSTDQSNAIVSNYFSTDNTKPLFGGADAIRFLYFKGTPIPYQYHDQRGMKYITVYTAEISASKYRNANPAYNVTLLRLAEMYLIKAESSAILGDTAAAYNAYKTVKKRAFGSYWAEETISSAALLDSIRLDHKREMIFEGDRYHNLKRLKQDLRAGVPWNDPASLFKIPQEEMSGNPLMIQNP